jgi:hypothetical protein
MDSTILGSSGQIEIIIVKRENTSEEEYRFYDEKMFYCFSLFRNEIDFDRINNGELKRHFGRINPEIDPIFVADTFSVGFVNLMKTFEDSLYNSRFNRAIDFYYSVGCKSKPMHISKFMDSHQKTSWSFYDEFDTLRWDQRLVYIERPAHKSLPKIPYGFGYFFKKKILKDITFTQNERTWNSNQLIFTIWVQVDGSVRSVELVSHLEKNNFDRITERLGEGVLKFFPGSANPTIKSRIMKAAFYIDMD